MSRRLPKCAIGPILGLALAAWALLTVGAGAQDAGSLVGAWYGELAVSEAKGSNRVDFRRWVRINRPDGTQIITFRFYFDNRVVWEQVWNGVWGYRDKVYWTECRSMIVNGQSRPCADRRSYDVVKIDAREMVYINRATRESFTVARVPDDYRLP